MLKEKYLHTDIILASQSPRRQELLAGLDIDFRIETKPVDELYDSKLQASDITDYLAILKAEAFKSSLQHNQLVITSDTIVWHQQQALGKPKDRDDVIKILSGLSNDTHKVYTSVCFTTPNRQLVINDCTRVHMGAFNLNEINYYIDTYNPMDKAGAYGIQDWIGFIGVTGIDGCYYNVMGLPLPKVYQALQSLTIDLPN